MSPIQQIIARGTQSNRQARVGVLLAGTMLAMANGRAQGVVSAPLSLTLSETGYAPLTITDTGNTGSVNYSGSYGDFLTNFIVGVSNKINGPTPLGQLQVQSLDVTSTSASTKTLSIMVTDIGYTPTAVGANLLLTSSLAGTLTSPKAGDTVSFQSTVVPSTGPNVTSGVQSFTTTGSQQSTLSFSVPTAQAVLPAPTSYGVIEQIFATLSNADSTAQISGSATVGPVPIPEPAGVSIILAAGIGLLGRSRRLA